MIVMALLIVHQAVLIFSDLLNGTILSKQLFWACNNIFMIGILLINRFEKLRIILKSLIASFFLLTALQFVTRISAQDGLFYNQMHVVQYFLGDDNAIVQYFLLLIVTSLVFINIWGPRESLIACFSPILASILIIVSWSGTGVACCALFWGILLILKLRIRINFKYVLYGLMAFFVLVVMLHVYNVPWVEYIVEDVLGKNMEFTGRIYLWQNSFNVWSSHKIFGIGTGGGGTA